MSAVSSWSSLESWTEDEDYATFERKISSQETNSPLIFSNVILNIDTAVCSSRKMPEFSKRVSMIQKIEEEMEPIYENLTTRKNATTVIIYGQFLRTHLEQIKDTKKQQLVKENVLSLFNLSSSLHHSNEYIATKVEEELAKMLDTDPKNFRKAAETMCSLLHTKQSRFMSIRRGIQNFFRK